MSLQDGEKVMPTPDLDFLLTEAANVTTDFYHYVHDLHYNYDKASDGPRSEKWTLQGLGMVKLEENGNGFNIIIFPNEPHGQAIKNLLDGFIDPDEYEAAIFSVESEDEYEVRFSTDSKMPDNEKLKTDFSYPEFRSDKRVATTISHYFNQPEQNVRNLESGVPLILKKLEEYRTVTSDKENENSSPEGWIHKFLETDIRSKKKSVKQFEVVENIVESIVNTDFADALKHFRIDLESTVETGSMYSSIIENATKNGIEGIESLFMVALRKLLQGIENRDKDDIIDLGLNLGGIRVGELQTIDFWHDQFLPLAQKMAENAVLLRGMGQRGLDFLIKGEHGTSEETILPKQLRQEYQDWQNLTGRKLQYTISMLALDNHPLYTYGAGMGNSGGNLDVQITIKNRDLLRNSTVYYLSDVDDPQNTDFRQFNFETALLLFALRHINFSLFLKSELLKNKQFTIGNFGLMETHTLGQVGIDDIDKVFFWTQKKRDPISENDAQHLAQIREQRTSLIEICQDALGNDKVIMKESPIEEII